MAEDDKNTPGIEDDVSSGSLPENNPESDTADSGLSSDDSTNEAESSYGDFPVDGDLTNEEYDDVFSSGENESMYQELDDDSSLVDSRELDVDGDEGFHDTINRDEEGSKPDYGNIHPEGDAEYRDGSEMEQTLIGGQEEGQEDYLDDYHDDHHGEEYQDDSPGEGYENGVPGEPQWNNEYSQEFDDGSYYGDPDNVALPEEDDVFDHDDYSIGSSGGGFTPLPEGGGQPPYDNNRRSGGSGAFWWIIGGASLALIALATWGSLWMSTGEINPVAAIKGTTSTTQSPDSNSSSVQTIEEEDAEAEDGSSSEEPTASAEGNADQERISELESSLTSLMDEAEQNSASPKTVYHTKTSTKTNTKTSTKTNISTRTNTKTVTNRVTAPAPQPRTVTKTDKVKVPGPERTITTTIPSGRVTTTITTTVIERWG